MNKEELELLKELKAKKKLSPKERATLKALEKKATKEEKKQDQDVVNTKASSNIFGAVNTVNIKPVPIRISEREKNALTARADSIKGNNLELVARELGSVRDINQTKLIRAAIRLLAKHSDEEVIEAIKEVKMEMFSGQNNV